MTGDPIHLPDHSREPPARSAPILFLRFFDTLFSGVTAALLAMALGLPLLPSLILGLGTGLLASSLCPVARSSGASVLGAVIGGSLSGALAAGMGMTAWAEVALVVSISLLATRVGRRTLTGLSRGLQRT